MDSAYLQTGINVFNLVWYVLFQHLANYASENLEAMNPPLFLRFLNLLMNDAIFLLDEAIQVRPWCILTSQPSALVLYYVMFSEHCWNIILTLYNILMVKSSLIYQYLSSTAYLFLKRFYSSIIINNFIVFKDIFDVI